MIRKLAFFVFLFTLVSGSFAQTKLVHFRKLQQFLPQGELQGFTRAKPTGTTQTIMGMSMSNAGVDYNSIPPETPNDSTVSVSIRVNIQDASFMPYVLTQFAVLQQDYESENENGYEKAFKVKDIYPGRLSVRTNDYKSCKAEFALANRFFVTLEIQGSSDLALLNKVVGLMDLEGLSKAEGDK